MPGLYDISATFFITLLNRLGVKPPPTSGFQLINTVQPVSLVDVDVQVPVTLTTTVLGTPFSAGHALAPAVNTVLADTGPLAAGTWIFTVIVDVQDAAANGTRIALQHRDSANAANIWERNYYGHVNGPVLYETFTFTKTVALNERIRCINLIVGSAGSFYNCLVFANQIA